MKTEKEIEKIKQLKQRIIGLENNQFRRASIFAGNVKVMTKNNVKDYGIYNYNLGFNLGKEEARKEILELIDNHFIRGEGK